MTAHQIQLIRNSWEKVKPLGATAGEIFYGHLFEAAPGVKHLFKSEPKAQAGKLIAMIGTVVKNLDKLDVISGELVRLAQRHNTYGAEPAHYEVVGACLLKTLQQGLGADWNDELKEAWATAYGILAAVMIDAQQADAANVA
jgi:hemoglobin-like flavoprotein